MDLYKTTDDLLPLSTIWLYLGWAESWALGYLKVPRWLECIADLETMDNVLCYLAFECLTAWNNTGSMNKGKTCIPSPPALIR